MNKHYDKVAEYFNNKASVYDDVDDQIYWALSDQFYKVLLQKKVSAYVKNKKEIKLLDAGAGTGRWSLNFYDLFKRYSKISGILTDVSKNMLEIAKDKIKQRSLGNIFECVDGNIEKMDNIEDEMAGTPYTRHRLCNII